MTIDSGKFPEITAPHSPWHPGSHLDSSILPISGVSKRDLDCWLTQEEAYSLSREKVETYSTHSPCVLSSCSPQLSQPWSTVNMPSSPGTGSSHWCITPSLLAEAGVAGLPASKMPSECSSWRAGRGALRPWGSRDFAFHPSLGGRWGHFWCQRIESNALDAAWTSDPFWEGGQEEGLLPQSLHQGRRQLGGCSVLPTLRARNS